jgi:hypothetical protein
MNYGEDVAYWYLRLNGFFPLSNFVLHPVQADEFQGDVDILAVRPPFVSETIGGQEDDFDPQLFEGLNRQHWIGVISEVKTGAPRAGHRVFRHDHVRAAVRRLGFFPPPVADDVEQRLRVASHETVDGISVLKLLIGGAAWQQPSHRTVSLEAAENFIDVRATKYVREKHRDRMYFPLGVFQYAIRRATRDRNHRHDGEE